MPETKSESHRSGFAALVGRANVGKSTLLNQLVGTKVAIVSNVPQTTRHRIVGVRTLPEGQVAFIDSPGFHKAQHKLGQVMLERAREAVGEADVLLVVVDASEGIGPGDRFVLQQVDPPRRKAPVLLVLNKIDQLNKGKLLPMIQAGVEEWGCREVVPVSATDGTNCERLLERVLAFLPEGPPLYPPDYVTDQREREQVAELIREKLLTRLRQEVPHAIGVLVDQMEQREDGLIGIGATILVERESQKGIVIGRQGRMLKEVGTAARRELEQRLGQKVFLELWVKVREGWRNRLAILRELRIYPGG
ncbi:MAG: GTPase Era [Acidobacteriota bacterium]|nr:GTPase Era [Acidobacteriota bacterium]